MSSPAKLAYEKACSLFFTRWRLISFFFYLAEEEINDSHLIADIAARDGDTPIYAKLGFTYGKAGHFKKKLGAKEHTICSGGRSCPSLPAPYKPTMADMTNFTPEIRQLYLSKYIMRLLFTLYCT